MEFDVAKRAKGPRAVRVRPAGERPNEGSVTPVRDAPIQAPRRERCSCSERVIPEGRGKPLGLYAPLVDPAHLRDHHLLDGEVISTAFVESTINQVVSKRMVNKQQRRWTPRGAHLLLQVRVMARAM